MSAIDGAWGPWGNWGSCSATCNGGRRTKIRNCDNPAPSNGGTSCDSNGSSDTFSESCNSNPCPGLSFVFNL